LTQLPGLLNSTVSTLQSQTAQGTNKCIAPPNGPEGFQSRRQFISFICQNSQNLPVDALIEKLREHGGVEAVARSSAGEISFDDFANGLKYFLASNAAIPKEFGVTSSSDWVLNPSITDRGCKYSLGEKRVTGAEMKFKQLSFYGSAHFFEMKEADLPTARRHLLDSVSKNNPNALIIEGFEFGQPFPCEQVLSAVFTPDTETHSEWDLLQKYGFLHRIPLIPGDNQRIEDSDIPLFFSNDKAKAAQTKKDLKFIDILYFYYEALQTNSPNPLKTAISKAQSLSREPLGVNEADFKNRFKELNGSELPTDSNLVRQAFAPSVYATDPKGTNRLADLQDRLRNQSLLRAVQIATKNYARPMVVFGSGHLSAIGNDIEKSLGPPVKVDFKNTCR